ncbi:hypothetical protein [Pseudomonas mosselii]|uniref:hypothetical protein n=1 Tax=Pseudomonas mosselii TaxID=78327 RepID=UPI0012FE53F7|nr:hypothetical protein [Pseudomonas mosselii]
MLSKYGRMRWLLFTVIFGMTPIFFRMLFYIFNKETGGMQLFTASDFISLGIVLQVSVFNEIKYTKEDDAEWRQLFGGCTALFLALFSVFYCLVLSSELGGSVDLDLILKVSAGLDIVLILLYLAVYGRIQAASAHAQKREVP